MTTALAVLLSLLCFFILPYPTFSRCECHSSTEFQNTSETLKLKLIAIASILIAGAIGVVIPILGTSIKALKLDNGTFFVIKAFAAGVILATGFIHILPDAFASLTSPCLGDNPLLNFPFAGFVAMCSAMGTMMIDSFATNYYNRTHFNKARPVEDDGEISAEHGGHVHVHTHTTNGHAHGSLEASSQEDEASVSDRIRHQVISQVLELGIMIHSVIIGISVGTSEKSSTIRPLVVALSFHQFFEGVGLGGCLVQANFRAKATIVMAVLFTLTTPIGIGLGIAVSSSYNESSSTALIVEGVLNSASAGILTYMSLVDLLAADFMNPKLQSNGKLQLGAHLALLLGAGLMSFLAKWA